MIEVSEDFLPHEMKEAFHKADIMFGTVSINSFSYLADDLIVVIQFDYYDEIPKQLWELKVIDAQCEQVVRTDSLDIRMYTDHYLLWHLIDEDAELYINGTDASPEALVADFYSLHQSTFGKWLAIDSYVGDLLGKARSRHAQFAKGPRKILESYAKLLAEHGRNPYFLNFAGLENANAQNSKKPLKLLTFGECYFIGQEFIFTKRSN